MKLYSYYISSCSWRVRTVLNYKNIKYEYIAIDIRNEKIKHSDEYTKISKTNRVPILELPNGDKIGESMAICEYLEEKYPDNPLYPKNLEDKAKIRNFCEIINSGMQPLQNIFVAKRTPYPKEWCKYWNEFGFKILERELVAISGKYCFGNEITMADVFLHPQVNNGYRFGADMEQFPTVLKINDNLKLIKEFDLAKPENQPDYPKKL